MAVTARVTRFRRDSECGPGALMNTVGPEAHGRLRAREASVVESRARFVEPGARLPRASPGPAP